MCVKARKRIKGEEMSEGEHENRYMYEWMILTVNVEGGQQGGGWM